MEVARLSNSSDQIPMLVSERLMNVQESMEGKQIAVQGQFRSYNKHTGGKSRLLLSVFVREWAPADPEDPRNPNSIFLDGFICKKPMYRTTPLGREITDLLIAVNRPYNKSDYIPAIAWGRNAKFAETLQIGQNIKIYGEFRAGRIRKKSAKMKRISRLLMRYLFRKWRWNASKKQQENKLNMESDCHIGQSLFM